MKTESAFEAKIRPFFAPILIAVLAAVLTLFITVPQFDRLKIDSQLLSDRLKATAVLQTKLAQLKSLDESSQSDTLDAVLAGLPLSEPFRESLLALDTLLARHQIGVSQIKVDSFPDYLTIQFMALGPMSSLYKFITDFDKISPLSASSSIEAARAYDPEGAASDSTDVYQAKISLRIFFKSPPKTIGRASDPLPVLTAEQLKTLDLVSQLERISPPLEESTSAPPAASRLFPP